MSAAYERNGQSVSSEDFYAIACDPRRSVAVEACAGAGKTWMLVSRMVRALLDTESPCQAHEILAITFTRRAAGEMRERLYDWLAEFARAKPADLLVQLQMRGVPGLQDAAHAQRLCEQLAGLYAQVLASGRAVQIRTFHSWFAALLRNAPVAVLQGMGLPVHYELLEDDAPARALLWRRFYAVLLQDADLKADFEAVVRQYGRFQADKALQAALDKRVEFFLADAAGVLAGSVLPMGEQFPHFAGLDEPDDLLTQAPSQQLLMQAAGILGRASAPSFAACGSDLERALTEGRADGVFKALLTLDGKPRAFGKKIVDIETVREAQDLLLKVQAARQQHEAWLYQQRMTRLTRALLEEFNALKRERGWVDMNDVERAALTMLGDPVLSGWVQEKLDARVKHLLIDEFQDTNPLQWQALRAWLDSYAGAGRAPSVFIVGDPKQSIYRFRRAEPQVFKAAQAFVREGLHGDLLSCDHTRRNARCVIDAVNAAMTQASQNDGYPGFRAHSTSSDLPGRLLRLPAIERGSLAAPETDAAAEWRDSLSTPREVPEDTLRTLEARQAAAWLQGQISSQGLKPSDLMVLSRKRAGLLPLQDELRALGIAAQVGEKTALIDCCEVQDIVALLDVLVSPQHDLSLARVLRSPLFAVDDAALVQLALARQRLQLSWYNLLQLDKASAPELYGGPAQSLTAIGPRLARWQGWVHSLPPHDALQAIYGDGDVLARFAAAAPATQRAAVLANLNALLAVALEHDGGRYVTPYALVRALKAGGVQAPATVDPDAVRLLTIHGAKGLEAPLVLLLDTDSAARSADSMGVLVDWPGEAAHPDRFVFLLTEARPPACCVPALTVEQEARQREELNALYVALTRAQHTLALSSITPHREAPGSWWQRLQPLIEQDAVPLASTPAAVGLDEPFDLPCLPTLPAEHRLQLPEPVMAADSSLARIGLAMHRLLEWGALSAVHVQAVTREFHLSPQQAQQALQGAERILNGQGAWAWNPAVVAWQGNEVELAHAGQVLRLDRLVQRQDPGHAGHWWVLDYKSRGDPQTQPELRAQMQGYRDAVQAIHPGQTVKAAFLTASGALIEL